MEDISDPQHEIVKEFLIHLALCHSVVIDSKSGHYNASSPDELALINAAKNLGCEFIDKDEENIV